MSILESAAFELTWDEKISMTQDVESLLDECHGLLASGKETRSLADYAEALRVVRDALMLASDSDACEFAPLARCHLYKGHALLGLKKKPEARDAYREAAKMPAHSGSEKLASWKAREQVRRMDADLDRDMCAKSRKGGTWDRAAIEVSRIKKESGGPPTDEEIRQALWNTRRDKRLIRLGKHYELWDPEPSLRGLVGFVGRRILKQR
ncbi:hypothetical protein F5Y15DRAFT_422665 [Xylariaceae sp. FL0016]|nr:hypothetical protein F5Y15DRAFT_422665 [Xylariaceae sp. FL0016]